MGQHTLHTYRYMNDIRKEQLDIYLYIAVREIHKFNGFYMFMLSMIIF